MSKQARIAVPLRVDFLSLSRSSMFKRVGAQWQAINNRGVSLLQAPRIVFFPASLFFSSLECLHQKACSTPGLFIPGLEFPWVLIQISLGAVASEHPKSPPTLN
jgi:hypothetical protein